MTIATTRSDIYQQLQILEFRVFSRSWPPSGLGKPSYLSMNKLYSVGLDFHYVSHHDISALFLIFRVYFAETLFGVITVIVYILKYNLFKQLNITD